MKKLMAIVLLAAIPVAALADVTVTAPVPAPDPTAQGSLSTAASENAAGGYDAGVDSYTGVAYQAAASTAQSISNQDSSNASSFFSSDWQQAAAEAQTVANDQTRLSLDQASVAQQDQATENTGYTSELDAVPGVQQANDSAVQTSVGSSASSSMGSITSQTGVPTGQVSMIGDTSFVLAGAATQSLMNGLATDGYQSNINAVNAAEAEAADAAAQNYGGAAYEASVNASMQAEADADYAENVAAAPTLATALDGAALATALSEAGQQLQQIQSLTGVAQGQNAGATTTAQAVQQTSALTGVAQGQTAGMSSQDTSYTSAADAQQSALNSASQQNEDDAWTAAEAWQAGLNAQYAEQAAQTIEQYDVSMESSSGTSILALHGCKQQRLRRRPLINRRAFMTRNCPSRLLPPRTKTPPIPARIPLRQQLAPLWIRRPGVPRPMTRKTSSSRSVLPPASRNKGSDHESSNHSCNTPVSIGHSCARIGIDCRRDIS